MYRYRYPVLFPFVGRKIYEWKPPEERPRAREIGSIEVEVGGQYPSDIMHCGKLHLTAVVDVSSRVLEYSVEVSPPEEAPTRWHDRKVLTEEELRRILHYVSGAFAFRTEKARKTAAESLYLILAQYAGISDPELEYAGIRITVKDRGGNVIREARFNYDILARGVWF